MTDIAAMICMTLIAIIYMLCMTWIATRRRR